MTSAAHWSVRGRFELAPGASIGSSIAGVGGSGIGGSGRSCWPSSSEPPGSGDGHIAPRVGRSDEARHHAEHRSGPAALPPDRRHLHAHALEGRSTSPGNRPGRAVHDEAVSRRRHAPVRTGRFRWGGAVALGYLVPALGRPVHHQRVREFHVPGERGRLSLGTRWRSAHVRTSPRGMRGPASPVQLGAGEHNLDGPWLSASGLP